MLYNCENKLMISTEMVNISVKRIFHDGKQDYSPYATFQQGDWFETNWVVLFPPPDVDFTNKEVSSYLLEFTVKWSPWGKGSSRSFFASYVGMADRGYKFFVTNFAANYHPPSSGGTDWEGY